MLTVEQCKAFIEKIVQEYQENHCKTQIKPCLKQENTVEKRDVKGYHGREILELLQNADDAYQKSLDLGGKDLPPLEVSIVYKSNLLTISNSGTFFDEDGIRAIVFGNISPKKGKYIGCKGTGFRSVLNWASKIRIFSGNFNVEFSKEIADGVFEIIKKSEQVKKQLKEDKNLYVPILAVPKYIENKEYDPNKTTIELEIDSRKIEDDYNVQKQLDGLDSKILLFLPNTQAIKIETENEEIIFKREKVDDEIITKQEDVIDKKYVIAINKEINGEKLQEEQYDVFERIIPNALIEDDEVKDVSLILAVPESENARVNNLYSYFPLLNTTTPFDCVMHATYELDTQRDTVNRSDNNIKIIKEQINHLMYIANDYIKRDDFKNAIKIITPNNSDNFWTRPTIQFSHIDVSEEFYSKLKGLKIFKDVNGTPKSFLDNPKFIPNDAPSTIVGSQFNNFVKKPIEPKTLKFIEQMICLYKINQDEVEGFLQTAIDEITNDLSIQEQVELFIWWNKYYRKTLPKLLKKQDNSFLVLNEQCYFLEAEQTIQLPTWVKVPALDEDYQKALFKQTIETERYKKIIEDEKDQRPSHVITKYDIYENLICFNRRDRNTIVPVVNSSVETYDNAKEFVVWLWNNCREYKNDDQIFNFPDNNGNIIDSNKLYIRNELSIKLFKATDYKDFIEYTKLGISKEATAEFEEFLLSCKVKKYPYIGLMNVVPKQKYEELIKQYIFRHYNLGQSSGITIRNCEIVSIEYLDNILEQCDTKDILKWLIEDEKLIKKLNYSPFSLEGYYADYPTIEYIGNTQYNYRKEKMDKYSYNNSVGSYILFLFNNTKWIEYKGERYAPREVILDIKPGYNYLKEVVPVLDNNYFEAYSINFEECRDALKYFSFCNDILDLSSNKFYEILLKIPSLESEISKKLSIHIYNKIEDIDKDNYFLDSVNKRKFFQEGKVLTTKDKYVLAKNVYLPSTKIINKSEIDILKKGARTNNKPFVEILGCKEYTQSFTIKEGTIQLSKYNECFVNYFEEYKKYAQLYEKGNTNIKDTLPRLSISLVANVEIETAGESEFVLDDFKELRLSTSKWYIHISDSSEYDIFKLSLCIQRIFDNIANSNGFDSLIFGELFRLDNIKQRRMVIERDFGSDALIDDAVSSSTIQRSFNDTILKINPLFDIDTVDIDFRDVSSFISIKKIIQTFKEINISSIADFEAKGFIKGVLDFTDYNNMVLKQVKSKKIDDYVNYIFNEALKDEEIQEDFITKWKNFENFVLPITELKNKVLNIEEILIDKFGDYNDISCFDEIIDYKEQYKKNYNDFNIPTNLEDEIINNDKIQTMIYFNRKQEFDDWIEANTQKQEPIEKDPYEKFRTKIPKEQTLEYSENNAPRESEHNSNKHMFTESGKRIKERNQKTLGNKGELLIYNYLKEKYGEEKVRPKSEAFITLNIILPGQTMPCSYDIEYTDEKDNVIYVEVKAGDKNSFTITQKELDFAKENADNYEVYVVYNIDEEEPDFVKIEKKFWDNEKYNVQPVIEKNYVSF